MRRYDKIARTETVFASNHNQHQPTCHRPGLPVTQEPGPGPVLPAQFGTAHIFYPEAAEERCTTVLLLYVDTVGLVRVPGVSSGEHYVNDRAYAASYLLSVAIARVFRSAQAGRCDKRPQLASTPLTLEVKLSALPT